MVCWYLLLISLSSSSRPQGSAIIGCTLSRLLMAHRWSGLLRTAWCTLSSDKLKSSCSRANKARLGLWGMRPCSTSGRTPWCVTCCVQCRPIAGSCCRLMLQPCRVYLHHEPGHAADTALRRADRETPSLPAITATCRLQEHRYGPEKVLCQQLGMTASSGSLVGCTPRLRPGCWWTTHRYVACPSAPMMCVSGLAMDRAHEGLLWSLSLQLHASGTIRAAHSCLSWRAE